MARDSSRYAVTADIAVFTIRDHALQLLLIKRGGQPFKDHWALPGGFLLPGEDLESCARRELQEETGLLCSHFEQIGTFSAVDRDPRERVITTAYLAAISHQKLRAASDAADAGWWRADQLPELAFDHARIISIALEKLRSSVNCLIFHLLPPEWTRQELHLAYEAVTGRRASRRTLDKLTGKMPLQGAAASTRSG